jgi:hypothetical protein
MVEQATGSGGAAAPWLRALGDVGEMGRRVAEHDWAATPLGPLESWPDSLRIATSICLTSRFPMLVVWGEDLRKIYNDAYVPFLGSSKHPAALGAPVAEVWPEIWDTIGPMFERVRTRGESTFDQDGLLEIDRHGFLEECYFTWSYSPIRDADGTIKGVFDAATEVTEQVVTGRRLACLGELATELVDCTDVAEVCRRSVAVLARYPADLPAAHLYIDAGDDLVLIASTRRRGSVAASGPSTREALVLGKPVIAAGTPTDLGVDVGVEVSLPLGAGAVHEVPGVLRVETSERRPFDQGYRSFVELVAASVGAALRTAFERAAELGRQREISASLQGAMLSPVEETATLAVRYAPAVGHLSVGGDWYDVVALPDGRVALVVGDCVGHGLGAATAMGQLRSASRVLLLEGHGPAVTLERLSTFAESVPGAACATVCCAVIDPADGSVTYASAGHPPPLVWAAGRGVWLDSGRSRPLGIDRDARPEGTAELGPDDRLLLYTDGLVERRGESIDLGLDRLRQRLEEVGDAVSAATLADVLLANVPAAEARDDVALLVYGRPPDA